MIYDDIVIGSGLSALATVVGLPASRNILILGGPRPGRFLHYDASGSVPCAYHGEGGLGIAWHGVIPMMLDSSLAPDATELKQLLSRFYPAAAEAADIGAAELFVPWRPIRPTPLLERLVARRRGRVTRLPVLATRFSLVAAGVEVDTSAGTHTGRRLWIAAGALHTPELLDRSLGQRVGRDTISDHVLGYVGQVDGANAPQVRYSRDGMFVSCHVDAGQSALYTLRPARFGFRQLDYGIEQRAAFGLPTGGAISKIARAMSAGLLTEAMYTRLGLLAAAPRHSIYAQVEVPEAYSLRTGTIIELQPRPVTIRARTDAARAASPFAGTAFSRRSEMYLPGIHLHHSVDVAALEASGVNSPGSPVQVVDASIVPRIGCAHHSFRIMLAAWRRARESS
ncbi:MAG: hypothetical protein ABIP38_00590 [Steroidobacteraceae bacterium]